MNHLRKIPNLCLPGDVVVTRCGVVGVIVKANVIVTEGGPAGQYDWNDSRLTREMVATGQGRYAMDNVPGYSSGRYAWWDHREFLAVLFGPMHKVTIFEKIEDLVLTQALASCKREGP